jgi:arylsulfatase A-like enzyme
MADDDFKVLTALYDAEIRYVDAHLGRLYRRLQDRDLLDETILIITSDHGENIGDHGLMDHQYCLYDTLLRVPLIIRYPPAFEPGKVVKRQVSLLDILPTLTDLVGQDQAEVGWAGHSLVRADHRAYTLAEYLAPQPTMASLRSEYGAGFPTEHLNRQLRCIRTERLKYIAASDGAQELYDLGCDPGETKNLVPHLPGEAARLGSLLDAQFGIWPTELLDRDKEPAQDAPLDPAVENRLRGLGYL